MSSVAIVTGAARGIGRAVCEVLEREGWDVVPVDRDPIAHANAVVLDLADAESIAATLGALPRVDALVNNAAIQLYEPLIDTTIADWDAVAAVNARAPFACLRATYRQLVEARGAVVNVASVHARATSRAIAAYAASKGSLAAFTRAAALELAPLGVRVNAVLPGAIETPALRQGLNRHSDAEADLLNRTPLGRIGSPEDVAEAVAFLVDGRRSGFIAGQELVVDGGALARLGTE